MQEPFWYFHAMKRNLTWINDKINEKERFGHYKENFWEEEYIVEVSGMDCDGVQYSGHLMTGPLSFYQFQKDLEKAYYDAEGPIHFRMVTPYEAVSIIPYSRDRMMEAYEDGHPSTLYY